MSAACGGVEPARAVVDWLWDELAGIAHFARRWWPWRNSPGNIAAAQFALEVERARRAGGGKGGRA
jgi:hypothetical protein